MYNQVAYESFWKSQPHERVQDPEVLRENLVEAKHRRMARSHRTGPLDRELKPNAKIRDELMRVYKYPPSTQLTPQECDLIWKFRFYATKYRKSLPKFIRAVDWHDAGESK